MAQEKLIHLLKKAQGNRTQNEFALHCGISSSAISRIKNGEYIPKPNMLKKIAEKAQNGVTFSELMEAAGHVLPETSSQLVPPPTLPGVYYRLGVEAQKNGITPEDAEKIIELYKLYKAVEKKDD